MTATSTAPATMNGPAPTGTQPLTALVPIIPGHRPVLQQVLAAVRARIDAGGPTPLDSIGTVHFARWVVVPDDADGGQLLFTTNFDGPWDTYIEDFAAQAADSFDAIYSHCEGWPANGARDVVAFKKYIRCHELTSDVYYRAYPLATVRHVRSALKLKASMNALLDAIND